MSTLVLCHVLCKRQTNINFVFFLQDDIQLQTKGTLKHYVIKGATPQNEKNKSTVAIQPLQAKLRRKRTLKRGTTSHHKGVACQREERAVANQLLAKPADSVSRSPSAMLPLRLSNRSSLSMRTGTCRLRLTPSKFSRDNGLPIQYYYNSGKSLDLTEVLFTPLEQCLDSFTTSPISVSIHPFINSQMSSSVTDGVKIQLPDSTLPHKTSNHPKSNQPLLESDSLNSICSLLDRLVAGSSHSTNNDNLFQKRPRHLMVIKRLTTGVLVQPKISTTLIF